MKKIYQKKGILNQIGGNIGCPITFYPEETPSIIYLKRITEKEYDKLFKKAFKLKK